MNVVNGLAKLGKKTIFRYIAKKNIKRDIIDKYNLQDINWQRFEEQRHTYPVEVQTEIRETNDVMVSLLEQDLEDVRAVKAETIKELQEELPYIFQCGAGDEFSSLYHGRFIKAEPVRIIASVDGKTGYDMEDIENQLWQAFNAKVLYGSKNGIDILRSAQTVFENFYNLIEETEQNLKIIRRGYDGEDYVYQAFSKYSDQYTMLSNVVIPSYEEGRRTSETDMYLVCSKGVFVCEVKNYGYKGQTINVTDEPMWNITDDMGRSVAQKKSPFAQNKKHCYSTMRLLRDKLGLKDVPIIPVFVAGNPDVELNVQTNEIAVKAYDIDLVLDKYEDVLDEETQQRIIKTIEENRLDPNTFGMTINKDRALYLKSLIEEYIPYIKANVEIAKMYQHYMKINKNVASVTACVLILGTIGLPLFCLGYVAETWCMIGIWVAIWVSTHAFWILCEVVTLILLFLYIVTGDEALGEIAGICICVVPVLAAFVAAFTQNESQGGR